MKMTYGIVYAKNSNTVRRVVVSDEPNYDYSRHVGVGEAHIVAEGEHDVISARAALEAATGKKSPEPIVAQVDKHGNVVRVLHADPELDAVPDHDLVHAHAGVAAGHTYDKHSGAFKAPKVD